jgi:hypothetical protein
VLVSLNRIRAEEIDFGRASGAETADADRPQRASYAALLKNRQLLIFGACAALFQVASASMMPLLGGGLAYEGKHQAAPLIAALIIAPQLLVGLLASWVGRSAKKHGRKPLLLVGFAALPVRALLFALVSNPFALILIQLLDVITGAVLGVLTPVVIADVQRQWTLQSRPGNVRHGSGCGRLAESDTYRLDRRSIWTVRRVCESRGRRARRPRDPLGSSPGD